MLGPYEILHRCVLEHERSMVLVEANVDMARGHYVGGKITQKYYRASYGVLPFIQIHSTTVIVVIFSNAQENHHDEIKFP